MINLHNIDCMEFMRTLPDKAYELAICDPPYKNETDGLEVGFARGFNYNTFIAPTKQYITELFRVSRNQIIWGFNYFLELLPNTDSIIFWYKHQNGHFSEGEAAWCSIGNARFFDRPYQKDIGNKIHPTQKPVALYKWLLKNYASPGDKIFDSHGGSMSIAIAAYDLGFSLDLCELDKDYFKAAKERYEAHVAKYAPASEHPVNKQGQSKLF